MSRWAILFGKNRNNSVLLYVVNDTTGRAASFLDLHLEIDNKD